MANKQAFGVDLGTGAVKIYDRTQDTFVEERNIVAVRNSDTVFAIGNDAYEMTERNPVNIELIRPMSNGRIHDVLMAEAVFHTLLRKCSGRHHLSFGYYPTIYFSVPTDMTEIERRAYATVAQKGRFRKSKVYLVEKPIADALSLGVPILRTKGSAIINIGEESTEFSVIADKRVIISRVIPIGGRQFTEAIMAGIRKKNAFAVSFRTAERLKLTLADLSTDPSEGCKVQGIDVETGLPRDGIVSAYNVSVSLAGELDHLLSEISRIMERIPPQIRTVLQEDGVYVTGGSSRIRGLESYMKALLGYTIHISENHEMSTVYGLREIMNHDELQHWTYIPGKKKRS